MQNKRIPEVAVITFAPSSRNYGGYLQAYATQKLFEQHGFAAKFIYYSQQNLTEVQSLQEISRDLKRRKWVKHFPTAARYLISAMLYPDCKKSQSQFSPFVRRYLNTTSTIYDNLVSLQNCSPYADIYCTGGDQMWNSYYSKRKVLPEYYLTWAPKGKPRISFCTSIGKPDFEAWEKQKVKQYLSQYAAISVREASAKQAIEALGIPNVTELIDPTLLLDQKEWEQLAASRQIGQRYILVYDLSTKGIVTPYAKRLSKVTGLPVIRINYHGYEILHYGKPKQIPTLEEFLSLFLHAEYVLTNSFHGTAFSIIFRKHFASIAGEHPERIRNILTYFQMPERLCSNPAQVYGLVKKPVSNQIITQQIAMAQENLASFMDTVKQLVPSKEA